MSLPRALIAHGGGPTAVLNASLAGAITAARGRFELLASRYGFSGLLLGELTPLAACYGSLASTPATAIGSSRLKWDVDAIRAALRAHRVETVFYTGGNGSMQTALELSGDVQIIGIPKTIDNDLEVTHHTPGYASTAYFFACAARDAGADCRSLPSPVCILETLGRNAGWIVAATALARCEPDDPPHLILYPELPRSNESIASEVESIYRRLGYCVIAVCEGQRDENGTPFGADVDRPDVPGHRLASNLGHTLARRITERTGLRARAERPGLIGRSCGPFARERDRREAYACGAAAVKAAAAGRSGVMVALDAESRTFLTPLETVARRERPFPLDWIDSPGLYKEYASPLIGDVPHYPRFWL
jgi:6-phosphofructokinase 1